MKVKKNSVVTMNYSLKSDAGDLIDDSREAPLQFIFGIGQIIPGLETALLDKEAGAQFKVRIEPENGYGPRRKDMVYEVPKTQMSEIPDVAVGMQLELANGEDRMVVTVTEVTDNTVTIDGNHPLAGEHLNFDVEIIEIRDATAEEISHGHVHGEHGHQH